MTHSRRTNDRRRRVLYSTHQADNSPTTAASRRQAERLREARRPTAAYGIRVQRRLRGRWFSLVPVRRRAMVTVCSVLFGLAALLCLAHYAAITWPSIAYRPEIARPLRLDRSDSFGQYMTCAMLAGCAGASLMIYQLRRYRIDDYQGRYRLWRLVLVILGLSSFNALVSMIDWLGAIMEVGFGQRVALTGGDWIRLVVGIGGAILWLRLIAEMRRCRFALGTLIASGLFFAAPEAARWNILPTDSVPTWILVTSAPLLAATTLMVSLGSYLRMLYREVREIEDSESLVERMQKIKLRLFTRDEDDYDEQEDESDEDESDVYAEDEEPSRKRRWWRRRKRTAVADEADDESDEEAYEEEEEEYEEDEVAEQEEEQDARPRRRWFGLRKAKAQSQEDDAVGDDDEEEPEASEEAETPKKKKRRFSLRLKPPKPASEDEGESEPDASQDDADGEEEPSGKKRRGLGGWLRSKKSAAPSESEDEVTFEEVGEPAASRTSPSEDDEEEINPDEIDWSKMSKSERRRLRKKLKRQGKAA